jgi:putative N6-adenine-specific DNA methylase
VAQELRTLGEQPRVETGGVSWQGDARSMMRANLWLRTASRVVVRVARFRATAFYELEKRAKKIEWERFLGGRGAEFRVTTHKSTLYHSDAIAQRLQEALGSRLSAMKGRRPRAEGREQLFVVRVVRDEFEISADSSGHLLHLRGYREAVGKAPLRETLAAALLLAAGWTGTSPLVDPLCGSGTIPIEGALIARRIAPGSSRAFAFQEWPGFDELDWKSMLDDARAGALASSPVPIVASDRDDGAITFARDNAERGGVAHDIAFTVQPLSAMRPPSGLGLVATNPPYGKRLSQGGKDVRNLYAQLGKVLRSQCRGWHVALYSPDRVLARQLDLALTSAFLTSNGGIRVAAWVGQVVE